jgi:hypothetical protein
MVVMGMVMMVMMRTRWLMIKMMMLHYVLMWTMMSRIEWVTTTIREIASVLTVEESKTISCIRYICR